MRGKIEADRKIWFSMWFLASVATFGAVFPLMFYCLIKNRNRHFLREVYLEKQIANNLRKRGRVPPEIEEYVHEMNAKLWAVSTILIFPVFAIIYLLSKDLVVHENQQDAFLESVFPEKLFMPQTIPIKKFVLITIITLGVGIIYWLYKLVNIYNLHFNAHQKIEVEVVKLLEMDRIGGPL